MIRFFLMVGMLITISDSLLAKDTTNVKLKVFIEGSIPDFDYLRKNTNFVDFVNDPFKSDVHIIVTRKGTASDGEHYYISYNPVSFASLESLSLNCITSFSDTQDEIRSKFTQSVKTGLLVFANEKQLHYEIEIVDPDGTDNSSTRILTPYDPWNNWVFSIGLGGGFEAEEQKQNYAYEISLEANRVTELWRVRNEYEFAREEIFITKYEDAAKEVIHAFHLEQEFDSRITYSLSSHWSAGIFLSGDQTTYRNIWFGAKIHPAIEYNIYPWDEVHRRIFTIGYYIGPSYYNYYETTLLGKQEELLFEENIKIELDKVEKWGELEVWLEAGHYFPNFKYYSAQIGTEFSIRVTKGLFIDFGIQAEKIKNQLYLPQGELSDEDLLLNTRKLPTSFEFEGMIGISYKFGSMYNNVVNQRL